MITLTTLLERYRKLEPPQASVKKLVAQAVRDECGIALTEEQVKLERGGVFLSCHPLMKGEIVRYTPHILSTLKERHAVRVAFIR